MAHRHSVDEYLETIYFLAFPIGEYAPQGSRAPTLAARVAEMLGVSGASAGEMVKRVARGGRACADGAGPCGGDARGFGRVGRRNAQAARARGADPPWRAQGGAPDEEGPDARGARRPQAPNHR